MTTEQRNQRAYCSFGNLQSCCCKHRSRMQMTAGQVSWAAAILDSPNIGRSLSRSPNLPRDFPAPWRLKLNAHLAAPSSEQQCRRLHRQRCSPLTTLAVECEVLDVPHRQHNSVRPFSRSQDDSLPCDAARSPEWHQYQMMLVRRLRPLLLRVPLLFHHFHLFLVVGLFFGRHFGG